MKLWSKILLAFAISLLVGGLVFVIGFAAPKPNEIVCNKLNINVSNFGEFQFISVEGIDSLLLINRLHPVGKSQADISLSAIEKSILQQGTVKDVVCYYTSNGEMNLVVTQRTPIFRVKQEFEEYYVDVDRMRMPISSNYSAYLPIVTGYVDLDFAKTSLYDFIVFIQSSSRWNSAFTQIHINPDTTLELVPRVGDFLIEFGPIDSYTAKLTKLDKFLSELPKYHSWDKYSVINLEIPEQVICKKIEETNSK